MGAAPGSSTPQPNPSRAKDQIMSAFGASQMSTPPPSSAPLFSQPPRPSASPAPAPAASPAVDPFASLVAASPRAGSPFTSTPAASVHQSPPSSSLLDLGGSTSITSQNQTQAAASTSQSTGGDEEWTFESSLPESTLPTTNKVRVLNTPSLVIDFVSRRNPGHPRQIHVVALFSNGSSQAIAELHFQVAVERV